MMQTLNPYNSSKTAEIMARYRPIAPKPESPDQLAEDNSANSVPQGIRKSPYLISVWNHLQARPTRTRKRGRTALAPSTLKRTRANPCLQLHGAGGVNYSPPPQVVANSVAQSLALRGFVHDPTAFPSIPFLPSLVPLKCGLETPPVATSSNTVSIPLVPCGGGEEDRGIDLNKAAAGDGPQEVDFMHQLEIPKRVCVISPQAMRPVGTSISVGIVTEDIPLRKAAGKKSMKRPREVEKEMELEELPAVVSDSNNKVRLTNPAYNEMVGQPECPWLDFMSSGSASGACKRIGGEVVLDFVNSNKNIQKLMTSSDGFTCWVRIEWEKEGKKNVVNAFCNVVRLACESKDYLFEWRFHVGGDQQAFESESGGSHVNLKV